MPESFTIAVRSLCEFTAKSGDLSARFTPSPSAQQGMVGHALLANRRGPGYEREIPLAGSHGALTVRGRADGYDRTRNLLEEFKTYRGDLANMAANQRGLHWAQLKVYGTLLCRARNLPEIGLALVYFDIQSEQETSLTEQCSAAELERHFEQHCEQFLAWARHEQAHRNNRDGFLTTLPFPHASFGPGQRHMAEAVYRGVMREARSLIEAPTGVGKTLGALFPVLRSMPPKRLDKILFLVAKTSGRGPALEALTRLTQAKAAAPLRVLEMAAKESACEYPGRACEALNCPLAQGFYDRLPQARQAALQLVILERATLRRVALEHQVCPYFLAQELARWCDVLVGDYSYYFEPSALWHALAVQNQWRIAVLVDEAHNLVPRGREMFSAALRPAVLESALSLGPAAVQSALRPVQRVWRSLYRGQHEAYAVHATLPADFIAQLQGAVRALSDQLADDPSHVSEPLLRFHFDALHFLRMAEVFDGHSLFDVTLCRSDIPAAGATLCIRNVNPAPFLAPRFAAATAAVLFSATLAPADFYRRLLGLPESTRHTVVDSPFAGEQLEVRIARRLSTRYRDRAASLAPMALLMAQQYRAQPGNYLAFFSSFDYLQAALHEFTTRFPTVPVWEQRRAMPPDERTAFLARFAEAGSGIGFAVLGGAFAEGIDLPGKRLIGAFIATLGLPEVNDVNAEIERRMQSLFDSGYDYTYLYPGLQKVIQAAGRVIRTQTDKGTLHLMDDRYSGKRVRELLPQWWRIQWS
jgi:DNA excision repair protein ERCC-2